MPNPYHSGGRRLTFRQWDESTAVSVDLGDGGESETTIERIINGSAAILRNQTGAKQLEGTVVVIDVDNEESFVLSGDAAQTDRTVGVLLEDIPNGELGLVQTHGYCALVNVMGVVAIGDKLYTTAGGDVASSDPLRETGSFAEALTADAPSGTSRLLGLTGASLKASSEAVGLGKEQACDGDTGTGWSETSGVGVADAYWAADLGSPQTVSGWRLQSAGGEGVDYPSAGNLYAAISSLAWSSLPVGKLTGYDFALNGWTLVDGFSGEAGPVVDTGVRAFDLRSAQYLLFHATDGPTGGTSDLDISEIEVFAPSSGYVSAILWGAPDEGGGTPDAASVTLADLETHHRFIIVAHQGDINDVDGYPSGSGEAIRQAIIRGCHWADLDLRKSSDGTWWIFHDSTVDATTNGTGAFSSKTDVQIAALNYDSGAVGWRAAHGTSIHPIKLVDLINLLKPYPCGFQFDCKILDDTTAAELAQFAVDEGIDHRVAFNLDTDPRIAIVRAISPNIFIGGPDYSTPDWDATTIDTFAEIAAFAPTWIIGTVDRADYPAADEAAILETLWDRGARGITANDIPATVAKLDELLHADLVGSIVTDHGALTGLTDDDHTQYLKETDVAAKGDLYAASANDTVGVLTVGSNNQVLTADSTQALGVKWETPSGSSGFHYELLMTGSSPPEPIENGDGTDWLYALVAD